MLEGLGATEIIITTFVTTETGWMEQYESTRERCIHGPQCRSGKACTGWSKNDETT